MDTAFQALLNRLQLETCELLSELGGWSTEAIRRRPSPEEWSALEVLDHLVRTEVAILAVARRGVLAPQRIRVADTLRTRFIHAIFRSDRRVKVPAAASQILPGPDLDLAAITQRWRESRHELGELLATVGEATLAQGIFRHPVAGWMGMPQILDFFCVHIVHHKFQLARLHRAVGMPARESRQAAE